VSNLELWLVERVRAAADLPPGVVDASTPVYRYGLDSRTLALIVDEAEQAFACIADLDQISPAETIGALAAALAPAGG
jgi:acyl carrier protein